MRSASARRRRPRWRARVGLVLCGIAAAGALAGCSFVSSLNPFSSSSESSTAPAASCPTATILRPLAQTATFAPGREHEPIGVAFYGILDDVSVRCERSDDTLRAALDVVVIGERGPAAGGGTGLDLQYFVAVTGPNDTILSKRSLPLHIAIPEGVKRAGVTDHIEEVIPLAGRSPGQLTIVLGFQLSPAVVDFYRHFRGR